MQGGLCDYKREENEVL